MRPRATVAQSELLLSSPADVVLLARADDMRRMARDRSLGRWIVADSRVCHGKPTFRGTRILVSDVLEMVAQGMAWETIIAEWHGDISKEAIAEAVRLSSEAFIKHSDDFLPYSVPA